MSRYDNTDRTAYILLGTMLGVGVGTVLGMLMAPRSGEESRQQLRAKAMEARNKARHQYHDKRDKALSTMSKLSDKSADVADQAKTAAKRTRDNIDDER